MYKKPLLVYICRPITGHSFDELKKYYDKVSKKIQHFGISTIHPMSVNGHLAGIEKISASGYKNPTSTDHAIKNRAKWMVSVSDIILVDYTEAQDKSLGCMGKLAWSDMEGKHSIVVITKDNPNYHAFVLECASVIFETISEAIEYLRDLTK